MDKLLLILLITVVYLKLVLVNCDDSTPIQHLTKYPMPRYHINETKILWFPRIIGGTHAAPGEFPEKVSLQTRRGAHRCGGSIINLNHVLTVAHCVTDARGRVESISTIRIMADDIFISILGGSPSRQIRFPSIIFVHLEYSVFTLANDIAVIRISENFILSRTLNVIERNLDPPRIGTICRLAGWGSVEEDGPASPRLQRIDVEIIDTRLCNGSTSYNGFMPPKTFCAGSMRGGRDSCQGDSGAALICGHQITGIASFGQGCGRPNFPGVYGDVSFYNHWINSMIEWQQDSVVPMPPTIASPGGSSELTSSYICIVFITILVSVFSHNIYEL